MAQLILWQQRRGVDIQRQKIADGILVFSAVETAEGLGASGVRMPGRRPVERSLDRGQHPSISAFVRTLLVRRWHLAGAQATHDFFPNLGMLRDIVRGDSFEIELALLHVRAV